MVTNDKHLMEGLQNGDESAFEVIYKMYAPRLYYFIYEYIPQKDIAENIVQETLMVLWSKKSELTDDTNLGAYLFTVAKNNCLYKLREIKYRQRIFNNAEVNESELEANYIALESLETTRFNEIEIEQIIEHTLAQLPPQCRTVFNLSRFKGMKNREIAEELNISAKAVEGHITKALKIFRVALKDYLPFVAFIFVR
ncbi:MAG: RNA polymerase sigma-70 factor [Prolixibacteraceae bacterium]|nr:RNA polymerase sigma-70 factor [Prolixibacteraceae bacterium]